MKLIFRDKIFLENYDIVINKIIDFFSPGLFILLFGDLGAGKTTFTKLIAKKMNVKDNVSSPTFNLLNRYKINDYFWLNHFDFFRMKKNENINFFEDFLFEDCINIIEWPDVIKDFWNNRKNKLFIYFDFPLDEKKNDYRILTIYR